MRSQKPTLDITHPELVTQWSERNDFSPKDVTAGSDKKTWWKCENGHEWQATISSRTSGNKSGCCYCSNRSACADNCMATTHPHLVAEWSPKNKLTAYEVLSGSPKKATWECSKGHEWQASPNSRTSKSRNCPYCSNQRVCADNCMATTHPHLVPEWSPKNKLTVYEVLAGSAKPATWECEKGHEWQASPNRRTNMKTGCPYCSNHRACSDNCLATTHPHLVSEWSPKNELTPCEVLAGSNKKATWQCSPKGHEWQASPNSRTCKPCDCPYCGNKKVCADNCLATTHPHLVSEWSPENKLTPNDFVAGSHQKATWQCSPKGHKWTASIYSRTCNKSGCPICNESHGEKAVAAALDRLGTKYKREFRLKYRLNGQRRTLFFDFIVGVGKIRAFVEFHGSQHYRAVNFFGGTKALESNQRRDAIKREACRRNNIPLLELPYWELENDNVGVLVGEFIGSLTTNS